ncbi:hypothetical protein BGW80DRAFT_783384 [Lactifluus volemus]|nr:hypothetical protein BGW80DRAFT_783384 [Lactifluus volemus]
MSEPRARSVSRNSRAEMSLDEHQQRLGHIKVRPEEDEDMWHLYNLIQEGDNVRVPGNTPCTKRFCMGPSDPHHADPPSDLNCFHTPGHRNHRSWRLTHFCAVEPQRPADHGTCCGGERSRQDGRVPHPGHRG